MAHPRVRAGLDQLMSFLECDPGTPELPQMDARPYRKAKSGDHQDQRHRPKIEAVGYKAVVERSERCGAAKDQKRAERENERGLQALARRLATFIPPHAPSAGNPVEQPDHPEGGYSLPGDEFGQGQAPRARTSPSQKLTLLPKALTISSLDRC